MRGGTCCENEGLSTGQRATALLRLLLAEVDRGPLVIDQPEDDLDNAFVHDQVVRDLRREKHGDGRSSSPPTMPTSRCEATRRW